MQTREIQELLLAMLPQWYCAVVKPFKQRMGDGVSMDMYYCLRTLLWQNEQLTMSELGRLMHVPKQQMTKLGNRLIECGFVERISDPQDRRIVRLMITDRGRSFIDHFLDEDAACHRDLIESMTEADRSEFFKSLLCIHQIFDRLYRCGGDENQNNGEEKTC